MMKRVLSATVLPVVVLFVPVLLVAVICPTFARAEENVLAFDDAAGLVQLETTGAVSIDSAKKHQGAGSLKLEPGAKALIKLRPTDGTGKVELWIYEDGASPADPKTHAAGAMWGLMQADGHMLTIGSVYAPYLSGNTTYATAAFNPDKQQRPWQEVQYLGIRRKKGWHRWTFDFDADRGLHILLDGQDINARHERFNWNKSRLDGFTSVMLFGDKAHSDQVLWVDDIRVTLGPPAAKKTLWPPPPPTPPADLTVLPNQVDQSPTPYSRWKNGPSQSADYFPIAVWLQDPKLAGKYKEAGFNLYIGLWKGPTEKQLDMLRQAGMSVICDQNEFALKHLDDKIIVGWLHGDEPDNAHRFDQYWKKDKQRIKEAWPEIWKSQRLDKNAYRGYGPPIPPAWIVRDYQEIREKDPSRPVMVNLGQGVAWEQYRGRGERTGHLEDYPEYIKGCDIVSFDIYPGAHRDLKVHNALWYVARGVRRLRQWSGDQKIVWNALESTIISVPAAKPTPMQVKAEVWMSIIHGSRGLIFFVHQFKPTFNEHALLDDPEMLAMVTTVNQQIHRLAPVLNSQTIADGVKVRSTNAKTPVHVLVKRQDNATYVFAVAMYREKTEAVFQLNGNFTSTTVEVLGENRTLVADRGKFTDQFEGDAVHLYRIK